MFSPRTITDAAGYTVADPTQVSPKDPSKKITTAFIGFAKPIFSFFWRFMDSLCRLCPK
jgi:hypothetical protein